MLEITNLILLILVDILDINQLWKEKIDRRVLHHLQNCRYNYKKIPYIKVFKKLLKVEKKEKLILENREFNFDSLEGNGINTYNKHISGLTGGLYSKKSSVYYKDFSESDKKRLFEIGEYVLPILANNNFKKSYISVVVPTVDLGFFVIVFCSIAIAGHIPLISSTSGFSIFPRNCFA